MTSITYLVKDFFIKRTKKNSFEAHNAEFISVGKLDVERQAHIHYEETDQFNTETLRFHEIITKFP